MKIEKLNDNKIQISFSFQELEKQNINYHTFMSNSIENCYIFTSLLGKAKEELNFNTENSKLSVETFELSDGYFTVTITKQNINKKKVILKRKLENMRTNSCIYKFSSIDNFSDFCNFIKLNFPHLLEKLQNKNSLLKINNDYFLIINSSNLNYSESCSFSTFITEFATFANNSTSLIPKFIENSTYIAKDNAIDTFLTFFS